MQSTQPLAFQKVALIGKYPFTPAGRAVQAVNHHALLPIAQFLKEQGCSLYLETVTAQMLQQQLQAAPVAQSPAIADEPSSESAIADILNSPRLTLDALAQTCDLGLVLGGDGTMLSVARTFAQCNKIPQVPLIGINQGRLGFITDIALSHYKQILKPILHGNYEKDTRYLIQAHVFRNNDCIHKAFALNDVVINRGAFASMVQLSVRINDAFVAHQHADGLIIATATGSTAYALSVGGPLLHPSVAGLVLAPIAPHNLSNRPLVVPSDAKISIEIVVGRGASVNCDMQSLPDLEVGDRIEVSKVDLCIQFLHPVGWNYFETLRKKLHWNEGLVHGA